MTARLVQASSLPSAAEGTTAFALGLTALAAVVSWWVAAYAWRRRPAAGATPLAALTVSTGWWALGYLVELLVVDPSLKLFVAKLEWAGVFVGPVAWVVFAFSYTGRDRYTSPLALAAVSLLPAIALVAVWTNSAHGLVWEAVRVEQFANGHLFLLTYEWGPLYWVMLGYGYLLWLTGAVLLVRTALDMPAVYRLQSGALVLGALMPVVANFATTLLQTYGAAFDMTPAAFAGAGLACTLALDKYDLLESRPVPRWVARDRIVEEMADAMVVTDTKWRVTDVNDEAVRLLDDGRRAVKGEHVSELLPGFTPSRTVDSHPHVETVTMRLDGGQRYFELRTSDFTDYHGRPIGNAVVLRDVTDRRLYLQQLEVMNRVLRHNLRTEANLLYGYANLVVADLEGGDDEGARRHATTLQERAFGLADIGEKARQLADLRGASADASEAREVSVREQLHAVVDAVEAEFPRAGVRLGAVPDSAVACPLTLELVVRELVENGVEHNPADVPQVAVWATAEDDYLVVRVVDDGPGIQPAELAVIEADGETPLQHGSGLGLWLVTWGVDYLGGEVSFGERWPTGTLVTVRAPTTRVRR